MKKVYKFEEYYNYTNDKAPTYNIGDYILVSKQLTKKTYLKGKFIIEEIEYIDYLDEYQYVAWDGVKSPTNIGQIAIISGKRCVLDKDIKRKLTPAEIEEFEVRKNTKKYNI